MTASARCTVLRSRAISEPVSIDATKENGRSLI
jgi:hypothetical protein